MVATPHFKSPPSREDVCHQHHYHSAFTDVIMHRSSSSLQQLPPTIWRIYCFAVCRGVARGDPLHKKKRKKRKKRFRAARTGRFPGPQQMLLFPGLWEVFVITINYHWLQPWIMNKHMFEYDNFENIFQIKRSINVTLPPEMSHMDTLCDFEIFEHSK